MAATERKKAATYRGVVSNKSGDKTVRVVVDYLAKHAMYGKTIRRRTVARVHDEKNQAQAGDIVEITKCRPMSKTKNWRLVRVVGQN